MITLSPNAAAAIASSSVHVNLGDLPTWLGVIAASVAAYFVYGQLRGQQEELARQRRALERQQADQIDAHPWSIDIEPQSAGDGEQADAWRPGVTVRNASPRPIRRVVARLEPPSGPPLASATMVAIEVGGQPGGYKSGAHFRVLPPGSTGFFMFKTPNEEYQSSRMVTRFTDDAGLDWQIDGDLHLEQLNRRDW